MLVSSSCNTLLVKIRVYTRVTVAHHWLPISKWQFCSVLHELQLQHTCKFSYILCIISCCDKAPTIQLHQSWTLTGGKKLGNEANHRPKAQLGSWNRSCHKRVIQKVVVFTKLYPTALSTWNRSCHKSVMQKVVVFTNCNDTLRLAHWSIYQLPGQLQDCPLCTGHQQPWWYKSLCWTFVFCILPSHFDRMGGNWYLSPEANISVKGNGYITSMIN